MGVFKKLAVLAVVAATLIAGSVLLTSGASIPVLNPSGQVANAQRNLIIATVLLSMVVVVPVFAMLGIFAVKYRASNTNARYEPDWSENKVLEGLWWGIPVVIIGVLGTLTWFTTHQLDPYTTVAASGEKEMKVQVIALRWKWLFFYPEQGVATLNHVPLPVDTPVRFVMTADAPMSAFWIPALGSQIYAMNSMESQLNLRATKVGTYTGYTTNINGEGYAKMTFATKVMNQDSFDAWIDRAERSDVNLNRSLYESLNKPKSEHDERTYTLSDTNLFDEISGEAMHGSHGGSVNNESSEHHHHGGHHE